jgi:pyruvate kinase
MNSGEESRGSDSADPEIGQIITELTALRAGLVAGAEGPELSPDAVHADHRESARNLMHYLTLRRHDLRPLQLRLAALGLSSLGRAESHVLATIDSVLKALSRLANRPWQVPPDAAAVDFAEGQTLLRDHTDALLGPAGGGRDVRIMVTMPAEAAHEYTLVRDLLLGGMDCMRINCAHDDADAWQRMIENLRRAEKALGRSCRICMDLAGPKLRTGPIEPGPAVVRVKPLRDVHGRVIAPARIWLCADPLQYPAPAPADATLAVPAAWLYRLRVAESIRLTDARGSRRSLTVADVTRQGTWVETTRTMYIVPGTVLHREAADVSGNDNEAQVGPLPPRAGALHLDQGDILILTRDLQPGRPATRDSAGRILTPAMIGCTIPEVFNDVRPSETIRFDDGKLGGVIEKVERTRIMIRITEVRPGGRNLRADKGINLPDSRLRLGALTGKDLDDLAFVARHADMVALSFANSSDDVEQLIQHLVRLGKRQPAIVLKIETRRSFDNLPDMLLTAMKWPCCGVMIARGDLAVECGFERMAEVQEEILWVCEAAHVPVIWATQVLENLARKGMPSRAEITDAAMGHRAECVMLNKGPHIQRAVRALDDILRRMQSHQSKKSPMLRELRLARARTHGTTVPAPDRMRPEQQ